jgi:hypothetical protein
MSGRPRVAEILLMRSPKTLRVRGDLKTRPKFCLWGWTVDNFQLSETVLKGRTGQGGSRRLGQLRKLRVSRPQASLCAGACVCMRAHHSCGSGLPVSRAPAPDRRSLCAGRARSSSTLGFTTWRAVRRLTQVLRGCRAKRGELRGASAGQGRASRAWGGCRVSLALPPPHSVARVCCMRTGALLWTHVVPLLERIREGLRGLP